MGLVATMGDHKVLAAGSLRPAVTDIIAAYAARTGIEFEALLGPSGALRRLIEQGEGFSLFLSASTRHSDSLLHQGMAASSRPFARNALCLMAAPGIRLGKTDVIDLMLDPSIRLGTSTPCLDPSGDYTWQMFRKIDLRRPGAFEALDRKALKLTGATIDHGSRGLPYVEVFRRDRADVFVSYCTNAVETAREVPGLTFVRVPDDFNVVAEYGMAVARDADAHARALAAYIFGPAGRKLLESRGFESQE
jgi:molybdenum ABC transporter molybdate-binding protein